MSRDARDANKRTRNVADFIIGAVAAYAMLALLLALSQCLR